MNAQVRELVAQKVRPTKESFEHMKYFQSVLEAIKHEIPELRGVAFFGSRSRGEERNDSNNPSDLDIIVFYDGTQYTSSGIFQIFNDEGEVNSNFIELNEKHQANMRLHKDLQQKIKQKFGELMKERGLPVDIKDFINGTILVQDISQKATDEAITQLIMYIDAVRADEQIPAEVIHTPAFKIASQFLFGVGNEVYKNRDYILKILEEKEQSGHQGEKYFRGLMNCVLELRRGENGLHLKLPRTINEARLFFSVK